MWWLVCSFCEALFNTICIKNLNNGFNNKYHGREKHILKYVINVHHSSLKLPRQNFVYMSLHLQASLHICVYLCILIYVTGISHLFLTN